ncbi:YbhB/YbcL family Raf kinase inhibitor-like protein [Latilactobacillus sakei]
MRLTSTGIHNGYFDDIYGGYSDARNEAGMPTYSIPFTIEQAPADTVTYAAIFYDLDAYEVTKGFPWIHWTLANLKSTTVLANSSQQQPDFVQGVNTWHSPMTDNQSAEASACYGGMTPPNRDHTYTLTVFALDCSLDLEDGFYLNQLTTAMKGHILDKAVLEAKYRQFKH